MRWTCLLVGSAFALQPILDRRRALVGLLVVGEEAVSGRAGAAPLISASREADSVVRSLVGAAVVADPGLAGGLVRLAFHDATRRDGAAGGADGSVVFELTDAENMGLSKPLALIQSVAAEAKCSLADAVAVAGAAAIEAIGGPRINVPMGRVDATVSFPPRLKVPIGRVGVDDSRDVVFKTLPEPGLSTVGLRRYFGRPGLRLTDAETVALMGSHGMGRHVTLLNMTRGCLRNLTRQCLEDAPVRLPFASRGVDRFTNDYFVALLKWDARKIERGEAAFIPTDVALVLDAKYTRYVRLFAFDEGAYRTCFARAYLKLVEPSPTPRNLAPTPLGERPASGATS
ncbi:heme peroxidase [Pelagophyceae sp. CCMP2097]|nr:heme peroxidase [Pelagophyceae sp. CCMP2097]